MMGAMGPASGQHGLAAMGRMGSGRSVGSRGSNGVQTSASIKRQSGFQTHKIQENSIWGSRRSGDPFSNTISKAVNAISSVRIFLSIFH